MLLQNTIPMSQGKWNATGTQFDLADLQGPLMVERLFSGQPWDDLDVSLYQNDVLYNSIQSIFSYFRSLVGHFSLKEKEA